jgi:hypothetical protein
MRYVAESQFNFVHAITVSSLLFSRIYHLETETIRPSIRPMPSLNLDSNACPIAYTSPSYWKVCVHLSFWPNLTSQIE